MLSDEDEKEIIQHLNQAENAFNKWSVVESEHQSLFLAKVEGETTPIIIHSFLTVKGTRKEFGITSVKKVVLSGMGRQAKPASVDPTELFKATEHQHRSYHSIFQANSKEELMDVGPKEGSKTLKLAPSIFLPKHIADVLLSIDDMTAIDMALVAKEAIKERIKGLAAEGVEEISDTMEVIDGVDSRKLNFSSKQARDNGGTVLQWLCAFGSEEMPSVKLQIPLSGTLIQEACKNAEICRLGRALPQAQAHHQGQNANEQGAIMAEHFEKLRDVMETVSNRVVDKAEGSKVKDILFMKQLEAAASTDGINRGEITIHAETILKTKDLEGKKLLFLRELKAFDNGDMLLSPSQTKNFCIGPWYWNSDKPDGASMMLMAAPGVDNSEAEENDYIITTKMHLQMSDQITEKEFIKYTDKSVKAPATFEEGVEVMSLQRDAIETFVGAGALIIQRYNTFLIKIQAKSIKAMVKKKFAKDKTYLFMIMHKVDGIFNRFFNDCYRYSEDLDMINFDRINLDRLISKIEDDELIIDVLPKFFKKLTKEKTALTPGKREPDSDDEMDPPHNKKRKTIVRNDKPNDEWSLKSGEDFMKKFFTKPAKSKPDQVCLKYWINNECVKGCRRGRSHYGLSTEQKKGLSAFVKQCRECK